MCYYSLMLKTILQRTVKLCEPTQTIIPKLLHRYSTVFPLSFITKKSSIFYFCFETYFFLCDLDKQIAIKQIEYVDVLRGDQPATIIRYEVHYNTTDLQEPATTPAESIIVRYILQAVGGFGCRADICSANRVIIILRISNLVL